MKQLAKAPISALAISLAALLFAGCSRHSRRHVVAPVVVSAPSFFEAEPNDDSFNANDMGLLLPGDFFYIEGSISDTGFDPFDGFLFTTGSAVHVDFRLFIDNQLADFDVCLYDPQFDEILACYETSSNPELGGVDVFSNAVDFHLVVNSFIGSGTYALEIDVQPLFLREASPLPGLGMILPRFASAAAQSEADLGTRPSQGLQAFQAYQSSAKVEPLIEVHSLGVDPETGAGFESVSLQRAD